MNNDMYNQTELIRGRWYRYDPDFDIWRPIPTEEPTVSKWAWIAVLAVFALVAIWAEYFR
jgi:hypothetical protein